jgi:hypothetical protein
LYEIFLSCVCCCSKAVDNENKEDTLADDPANLRNTISQMKHEMGPLKEANSKLQKKALSIGTKS